MCVTPPPSVQHDVSFVGNLIYQIVTVYEREESRRLKAVAQ